MNEADLLSIRIGFYAYKYFAITAFFAFDASSALILPIRYVLPYWA